MAIVRIERASLRSHHEARRPHSNTQSGGAVHFLGRRADGGAGRGRTGNRCHHSTAIRPVLFDVMHRVPMHKCCCVCAERLPLDVSGRTLVRKRPLQRRWCFSPLILPDLITFRDRNWSDSVSPHRRWRLRACDRYISEESLTHPRRDFRRGSLFVHDGTGAERTKALVGSSRSRLDRSPSAL
jgi:hypothetical protein